MDVTLLVAVGRKLLFNMNHLHTKKHVNMRLRFKNARIAL